MIGAARSFASRVGMTAVNSAKVAARNFAAGPQSAHPEVPLHYYQATKWSVGSINHRMFYINITLMVLAIDAGSAMLDI